MDIAKPDLELPDRFARAAVAVLLLLLVGCSSESTESPRVVMNTAPASGSFHLELEQVFGGDESADDERSLLGQLGSVGVHESGDVYVVDTQGNNIVAFHSDGSVKWREGEAGQGPGEIQWPGQLIVTNDELLLVNQGGGRVDRYDLNGNYKSVSSKPSMFKLKCVLPNGLLLGDETVRGEWRIKLQTASMEAEIDSLIVLVDVVFEVDEPAAFGASNVVTACSDSELLVTSPGSYLIRRYSSEGEYLGGFGRSDIKWSPPVTASGNGVVAVPVFRPSAPLGLGDNGYLIVAEWLSNPEVAPDIAEAMLNRRPIPESDWQYSLDLFDRSGKLVGVQSGDGDSPIGRPITSDGQGAVYTYVHGPIPQVRRYRIVVD